MLVGYQLPEGSRCGINEDLETGVAICGPSINPFLYAPDPLAFSLWAVLGEMGEKYQLSKII